MMRKHIVIFSLSYDENDTLTLFGKNMPIYRTLEIKNIIATKNCDICSPSLIPLLQDKLVGLKTYHMQVQCKNTRRIGALHRAVDMASWHSLSS